MAKEIIEPLRDHVVLIRLDEGSMVKGVLVPEGARERPQKAKVVATGPKVESTVQKGDIVLIGKFVGVDARLDDTEYTIVEEKQILCVVRESNTEEGEN